MCKYYSRYFPALFKPIHANHYDFGVIFTLLNSNYAITIITAMLYAFYCTLLIHTNLYILSAVWPRHIVLSLEKYWYFETKSLHNHSHQRPTVKLKKVQSVTCHMWSHSVTCHPTQVNTSGLSPSQTGLYSTYLLRRDGRLSWPRRLVTYQDGLAAHAVCHQSMY